jgi:hypothetical protein
VTAPSKNSNRNKKQLELMKKILYFALAALIAGCSSEDESLLSNSPLEKESSEVNLAELTSDVPIEFGVVGGSAYVTRGSIDETNTQDIPDVRVFCLARRPIMTGLAENRSITWSKQSTIDLYNILGVWQDNVRAHVKATGAGTGKIVWDDPNEMHYYPSKDWYSYGFVAFHPSADSIQYASSNLIAFFTVDGNDDVFYAKANNPSADIESAYSSFFYKDYPGAEQPYFDFKHMMAKLVFKFKLKDEPTTYIYVDSVVIENYPNVAKLTIARRPSNATDINAASGLNIHQPSSLKGNYWLREKDDTSISGKIDPISGTDYKYKLTTSEITVGDGILLPPVPSGASYSDPKLRVYLKDDAGNVYTTAEAMTITCPSGGWKGAKQYNINVTLKSPVLIMSEARFDGWTSVDEDIEVSD